jgi:acyl carrier protein
MIEDADLFAFFQDQYRLARGTRRDIRPGDRLYDDLGIDSLLANELLIGLEDRYDLHLLHDPRAWKVATVAELLGVVRQLESEQRARAEVQAAA